MHAPEIAGEEPVGTELVEEVSVEVIFNDLVCAPVISLKIALGIDDDEMDNGRINIFIPLWHLKFTKPAVEPR